MDTRQQANEPFARIWLRAGAFILLLATGLTLVLSLPLTPSRYELRIGDLAPRTIKSPRDVSPFISESLTNERRQRVAASTSEVLLYDAGVADRQIRQAQLLFQRLNQVREMPADAGRDVRLKAVGSASPTLDSESVGLVVDFEAGQWKPVQDEVLRLLQEGFRARIAPRQLDAARTDLADHVRSDLNADQAQLARALAIPMLQPNLVPDPVETERTRQVAIAQVEPVSRHIIKGETIVRDGQVLNATDLENLQAAGLTGASVRWREFAGTAVMAFALSLVLGLYLARVQRSLLRQPRQLLLLALVVLATVLAAKLTIPGRPIWAYVFPVAAGPMLIATLIDTGLAVVLAGLVVLPVAYLSGYTPELTAYLSTNGIETLEKVTFYFTGALAGILGVSRARRVLSFFLAGGAVSAACVVSLSGFWLLTPDRDLGAWGSAALAALANGVLAAALTVGSFVVLGHLFGITTSMQLLELSQPDQPLLRRLLVEAPGTYYHSILVGNLAERAAEVVAADPLLARVGAYYHDIGKVANPGFFIENQRSSSSPHDPLSPTDSAAIIVAHVHDGLRLAQQHRLPAKVQDFICEHHGTRLAVFFYHQATELAADPAQVKQEDFSYPGPRPHSKETAVVMLADSVEAATRSLGQASPAEVDDLVDRIVAERVAEGQLDDSQLTLRDLQNIRSAFKEALRGIFHPRIAYPASTYVPEVAEGGVQQVDAGAPPIATDDAAESGQGQVRRPSFFNILGGRRSDRS